MQPLCILKMKCIFCTFLLGNLCVEENNRRLVPEEVWRMLKKYFPNVNEFTSDASPCGDCKVSTIYGFPHS